MPNLRPLAVSLADIALSSVVGAEGAPAVKDALNHGATPAHRSERF